jgi:hexosaminidase
MNRDLPHHHRPAVYPCPRSLRMLGGSSTVGELVVRRDSTLPSQGYSLIVDAEGARMRVADEAGERYGRSTFDQWCADRDGGHDDDVVRHVAIEDHPDLAVRGVMLDVSRDKVPTMATLLRLIEQLADWRYNQLQLYIEHTFAFEGYDDVWWYADPFTGDEIRRVDAACRARGIELVPNQNCLGHMERWLRVPRLRSLAACPDGFEIWGAHRGPTTLDPANPAAFDFVRGLLRQILPHYSSKTINVGLDEPWEFGEGRRAEYIDWVRKLRDLPELDGYQMQVWGDILTADPALVASLPDGITVNEWGYEASHDFAGRGRACTDAQRPWIACAGTSSWQTILGRTSNMRGNIHAAVTAACDLHADGLIVADWGDYGHLQSDAVRQPAFALAAGIAWCAATNAEIDAAAIADPAALALGDVYLATASQVPNCSRLVRHLYLPQITVRTITQDECDDAEARTDSGVALLGDRVDDDAAGLRLGADLVRLAIDDARGRLAGDGTLGGIAPATRAGLAEQIDPLIDRHRELWLRANRPGGLDDSVRWLRRAGEGYRTGIADDTWPYPTVDLTTATPDE